MILTIRIILWFAQLICLIVAVIFLIRSRYFLHQSDRLYNHKGKQTFWQWVRHIDTPRGTGVWK